MVPWLDTTPAVTAHRLPMLQAPPQNPRDAVFLGADIGVASPNVCGWSPSRFCREGLIPYLWLYFSQYNMLVLNNQYPMWRRCCRVWEILKPLKSVPGPHGSASGVTFSSVLSHLPNCTPTPWLLPQSQFSLTGLLPGSSAAPASWRQTCPWRIGECLRMPFRACKVYLRRLSEEAGQQARFFRWVVRISAVSIIFQVGL